MKRHHACWLLPATFALATATALAQVIPPSTPPKAGADPSDAAAPVAPMVYRSSLATYQRLGEPEPLSWREANDRVGRIGGWRAYAREAMEPEPAASAAPSSPPKKDSHDDHKMHGGMK
jgi:hypothetical protein